MILIICFFFRRICDHIDIKYNVSSELGRKLNHAYAMELKEKDGSALADLEKVPTSEFPYSMVSLYEGLEVVILVEISLKRRVPTSQRNL